MELSYDPIISLFHIYPKKLKTRTQRSLCIHMFTASLFTITKRWKQSKHPLTGVWQSKYIYIYIYIYICCELLLSHKKI